MALDIHTFSNKTGGDSVFKAMGHPLTADAMPGLLARLGERGAVALYDPFDQLGVLAALHDLSALKVDAVYVQSIEEIGAKRLGTPARSVLDLPKSKAATLLVVTFDADRPISHIRHLIPDGMTVESLDAVRISSDLLTNKRKYLDKLNFATNLGFLRDANGRHSRIVTANYWSSYSNQPASIWCRLFDSDGVELATWMDALPGPSGTVVIDSKDIRSRFGLGDFTGTVFMHVVGAAGHDIVKYALDTYGDAAEELSCTHDANAWPADLYAGLPAPGAGERVILWLQNAHPSAIPSGALGLNRMGSPDIKPIDREIPAFGTYPVDVGDVLPNLNWPEQIELQAGKHVVRPRYEMVSATGRHRIAHVNVERTDLTGDPAIPGLAAHLGKGYLLPAPVLPTDRFESVVLPTPMSTAQSSLPVALTLYDADGTEVLRHPMGVLGRDHAAMLEATALLREANTSLSAGWGHMELSYDFTDGGHDAADGWLHALFRYQDKATGHAADTSFGAHVFNTAVTYKSEPQSYAGPPPGLSTRLFLRMGPTPVDTHCHLVYPASTPWYPTSETDLVLTRADGTAIETVRVAIPCSGSLFWRVSETFEADALEAAGDNAYVLIRDTTCRLFGYHGLIRDGVAFSLDHMFGF